MTRTVAVIALSAALPLLISCTDNVSATPAATRKQQTLTKEQMVERGKYLLAFGGCSDCHTPFVMGPKGPEPDMSRFLSGHPAGLVMPRPPKLNDKWAWAGAASNTAFAGPWGISYARNLTPDQISGLGIWTEEMFVKAMRTGRHMGVSRPILPPMPWQALNSLNDQDLKSIYAYLRTIEPIRNEVPDPIINTPAG